MIRFIENPQGEAVACLIDDIELSMNSVYKNEKLHEAYHEYLNKKTLEQGENGWIPT